MALSKPPAQARRVGELEVKGGCTYLQVLSRAYPSYICTDYSWANTCLQLGVSNADDPYAQLLKEGADVLESSSIRGSINRPWRFAIRHNRLKSYESSSPSAA